MSLLSTSWSTEMSCCLTWSLCVFSLMLVLFGLVLVCFTNPHSCLEKVDVKGARAGGWRQRNKPLNLSPFFTPPPFLKVPAVSLPSFQRMTPSPTIPATQTAAAVRAMMLTRRHSCWMSRWRGRPAPPTLTARHRHLVPCSGLFATPPARGPRAALPLAPLRQLVSGPFMGFICHVMYQSQLLSWNTLLKTGLLIFFFFFANNSIR